MEGCQRSAIRRKEYQLLLDTCSQIASTVENVAPTETLQKISNIVKRSDKLLADEQFQDRVENTTEIVVDVQVIKGAHEILGTVVQCMENAEISDDEFVVAINRTIGPNRNWDTLAEQLAVGLTKTVTYSQPLFGTFDEETVITEKEVKERRINTIIKNSQQVKPKAVVQSTKKQEEQEAETVNFVGNQIIKLYEMNNKEPLQYYKLIVHPDNFMRTIQNAFQVSFLLRDGAVVIGEDEFGYPTVRPVNADDSTDYAEERCYQMISNLTTVLCNEMIQRYHITEPMIAWTDNDESNRRND